MSGREPEEAVRVPVLHQAWREMLFLHWRYPAEAVAQLLPEGLEPDLHDGSAWVSLTPFRVESATVPPVPAVPRLSGFPETNLRTYVRGPDGLDGLWFLTLEVANIPTRVAGSLAAPYRLADMAIEADGASVTYRSARRSDPSVRHHIRVRRLGPLAEQGFLDDWLTGRWRAWIRRGPMLATVPVRHQPWSLHGAELLTCDETLLAAHGLPPPQEEPLVHASPGVDARLGPPRPRRHVRHGRHEGR